AVAICGSEQVPPALLQNAETIAADVYRDIGVAIDWTEECGDTEGALEVDLVGGDNIGSSYATVPPGFAAPGTSEATILYDRGGAAPELLARDARPFGHRGQLAPHDIGIDGGLADPRAVAAVGTEHHVLPAHQVRVAADALRDELRVLDEVRLRFEHAGNQD